MSLASGVFGRAAAPAAASAAADTGSGPKVGLEGGFNAPAELLSQLRLNNAADSAQRVASRGQ